jgi:L-alanine-DL-glutamate epimerase-like enolase superfamily enzyme
MIGCMVCTSLGIAPALPLAAGADFVDLDGPWWLREDREGGVQFHNGRLIPPSFSRK